ncbi:MAG TPA: hypothetical protein VKR58_03370 [Aquella sp.]|nr:hypothetical protein [Aquella sp.]
MKINFTKKEYRLLVDMLYLSDWMLNSHIANIEEDGHPEYEALRKKLLSHYKEMSAVDIISYDHKHNDYFETQEYEDSLHKQFIDPYNDEIFWDELADRLALQNLAKEVGDEKFQTMDRMERLTRLNELSKHYTHEFETYGLEHVQIQKI